MAQQLINIGSAANDKSGDALRTAFTKTNANFTDLYSRGVQGAQGIQGFSGANGVQGTTGTQGPAGSGVGIQGIKTTLWGYPTGNTQRISNAIDGEGIIVASSSSAALRWHVRDQDPSLGRAPIYINAVTSKTGTGPFEVTFDIGTQSSIPVTGYHYIVYAAGGYPGTYMCTGSTINSVTLEYPSDPGDFLNGPGDAYFVTPSLYSQVQTLPDGVWIKNADWTESPTYAYYWQFDNSGTLNFPISANGNASFASPSGFEFSANTSVLIYTADGKLILPPNGDILYNNGTSIIDVPQNKQLANYTLQLSDRGCHIYANTVTNYVEYLIPTNAVTPFPIGSKIVIVTGQTCPIFVNAVTPSTTYLYVSGLNYAAGGYDVPANSMVTLLKIDTDTWMLSGSGVTID